MPTGHDPRVARQRHGNLALHHLQIRSDRFRRLSLLIEVRIPRIVRRGGFFQGELQFHRWRILDDEIELAFIQRRLRDKGAELVVRDAFALGTEFHQVMHEAPDAPVAVVVRMNVVDGSPHRQSGEPQRHFRRRALVRQDLAHRREGFPHQRIFHLPRRNREHRRRTVSVPIGNLLATHERIHVSEHLLILLVRQAGEQLLPFFRSLQAFLETKLLESSRTHTAFDDVEAVVRFDHPGLLARRAFFGIVAVRTHAAGRYARIFKPFHSGRDAYAP